MALDTRDKRASAVGVSHWAATLPLPDAAIDDLDRHHVAGAYRLQADAPPTGTGGPLYGPFWRLLTGPVSP